MYTQLSEVNFSSYKNYTTTPSDDGYDWQYPFVVEFDVQSISNPSNHRFRIYDTTASGSGAYVQTLSSLGITDTDYHHFKFEVYEDKIITTVDDSTPTTTNKSWISKLRVNWTTYGADTPSTNVKNFKIYPI